MVVEAQAVMHRGKPLKNFKTHARFFRFQWPRQQLKGLR